MMASLEDRMALRGRTAAVIGGAFGIGRAVSLTLAEAGVDLFIADVDEESLAETCAAATALGRTVTGQRCDVLSEADVDAFYTLVEAQSGTLDIVVNLAGGTRRGKLLDRPVEEDARDIRRNYGYVVQSYRRAIPLIRRGGRGGSIISFTTIEAHRGAATFSVYAGAKAATTNFTKAMAVELGAEGIRCNCVVPDTTPSRGNMTALGPEMVARLRDLPAEIQPAGRDMYVPMRRSPLPEELANGVLFLASGLASAVTGIDLHVDGGTSAASGFIDWPHGDGHVPTPLAGSLPRLFGTD
ncbi:MULTISPECIES: SDR family NAD(P)-dependent oxidoreductase [unclassified Sphingobium]|uniref:SDR family NAD(P)-dependent oxidoreductase n=1 Tax=unclassified Sphingobium TaxID=2611147 RepID=UPI000D176146|nr:MULTISPECIES: SDR family oxidoreductase [unclassified Sphingobium]MBG6120031.1 NAD(P)-dependent dehydrogenase (short-subunit alcohol dehydrogenase family) [Sphingobium sp. JAI105]PSO12913.1 NAD(P)-dependent oxidoreductase [Sphingobium sp. AEW4]TWD05768.1 NAD(P)-dependent dehydrogenase (short-subunit alcohol dehydrogenase family) [Sphingobium sp. AEW010]TWD23321.1 NAD(P)-dependent dehydrogenase (short-subunit alcohol dehydrogenase family) [Sphingobium sp. AEW013]TWD25181.1 NAD(P)-dependent d